MDFGGGEVWVVDHEGDGDVLGWEFGESPLRVVSVGFGQSLGRKGMQAYQVDDLVVAGRQDITAIVMEGLVAVS